MVCNKTIGYAAMMEWDLYIYIYIYLFIWIYNLVHWVEKAAWLWKMMGNDAWDDAMGCDWSDETRPDETW